MLDANQDDKCRPCRSEPCRLVRRYPFAIHVLFVLCNEGFLQQSFSGPKMPGGPPDFARCGCVTNCRILRHQVTSGG